MVVVEADSVFFYFYAHPAPVKAAAVQIRFHIERDTVTEQSRAEQENSFLRFTRRHHFSVRLHKKSLRGNRKAGAQRKY